jgi:hypothetical protein
MVFPLHLPLRNCNRGNEVYALVGGKDQGAGQVVCAVPTRLQLR